MGCEHAGQLSRAHAGPGDARQRANYGQSHAVDIVVIDGFGLPARGLQPADPSRYEIFGHRIHAPCDGVIVQAANDRPDMPVPVMDARNMAGNHVLLRCQRADILLAHFRQGSVRVRPGDVVQTGRVLAEVGNSGNSGAPHLHIHAQERATADAPFSGKPLPMLFGGRYLVRGDRL